MSRIATPPPELNATERTLVRLTNAERDRRGCADLAVDSRLARAARGHAVDMARRNYFSHVSPDGEDYVARSARVGFPTDVGSAENLALGYASARSVLADWMGSPEHRANILNCSYDVIGVGYDDGIATSDFSSGVWVQVFADL